MKIFLDAGHGGKDPGAIFKGFREKDITLAIVLELRRMMQSELCEHTIVTSRVLDEYVTLIRRVRRANTERCDVFLSIHCNADPDHDAPDFKEASGAEVWVYPKSERAAALADRIGKGFRKVFPRYPWRGVKETEHFYVLKKTAMVAALVEVGFIDSHHDAAFLSQAETQRQIARILLDAVAVPAVLF